MNMDIDLNELLEDFADEAELLSESIEIFEKTGSEAISNLRASFSSRDFKTFERIAHTLKGNLRTFRFNDAAMIFQDLEHQGAAASITASTDEIEHACTLVSKAISVLLDIKLQLVGKIGKAV